MASLNSVKRKRRLSRKPLSKRHTRVEPTVSIPVADIDVGSFDHDPQALSLFKQQLTGKIKTGLTRVPLKDITTGFFIRRDGRTVHVSNLNSEDITTFSARIRGGWRPQITIYWNSLAPTESKYVCPDDEIPLAAYRALNLEFVPCSILKPRAFPTTEGCIWIEGDEGVPKLARAIAPSVDSVAMMIMEKKLTFPQLIKELVKYCADTRKKVKAFHLKEFETTHYHHVLYALLKRHERILDSIWRLVALKREEHAAALVRVAYEAFLNFYIDWISPSFFGPRLQLLGEINEASIAKRTKLEAHPSFSVLKNFARFLSRTADKANISPLSATFHNRIYPSLSLVSHQSYGNVELEANDFSDEPKSNDLKYVDYLGTSLNIITMALVKRARNEVGVGF